MEKLYVVGPLQGDPETVAYFDAIQCDGADLKSFRIYTDEDHPADMYRDGFILSMMEEGYRITDVSQETVDLIDLTPM